MFYAALTPNDSYIIVDDIKNLKYECSKVSFKNIQKFISITIDNNLLQRLNNVKYFIPNFLADNHLYMGGYIDSNGNFFREKDVLEDSYDAPLLLGDTAYKIVSEKPVDDYISIELENGCIITLDKQEYASSVKDTPDMPAKIEEPKEYKGVSAFEKALTLKHNQQFTIDGKLVVFYGIEIAGLSKDGVKKSIKVLDDDKIIHYSRDYFINTDLMLIA